MFARSVTIRLKPNSIAEFNRTLENEILPLLRKQKGSSLRALEATLITQAIVRIRLSPA